MAVGSACAVPSDVHRLANSTRKIAQIVGDYDRQRADPTQNLTGIRYGMWGTDLGVPFLHKGKTYVLFGDVPDSSSTHRDRDPLAWTEDTDLSDGLSLEFFADRTNKWKPIDIPGVSQGAFEVPTDGVSVDGDIYIWHTTDAMGRSVVARSQDDGATFELQYGFSSLHFINVSAVKTHARAWAGAPSGLGEIIFLFGSGKYRASNVRLAYQPADQLANRDAIRFFAGWRADRPVWSNLETEADALFIHPQVGELSIAWNSILRRWLMLYNSGAPRGIQLRTALAPWGPWSDPQTIFDPWQDPGYCHFIHTNWNQNNCDSVHDPGREYEWGGEYGPYLFEHFTHGTPSDCTIYFTLSTWNPYTVVLMECHLALNAHATIEKPRLVIGKSAAASEGETGLYIEWPAPSYGWLPEGAGDLTDPSLWLPFESEVIDEGDTRRCEIPRGPARWFLRLKSE